MAAHDHTAGTDTERPTDAARGVFRREGEYWTISYRDSIYRLRDIAGLRHLAYLLRRPGQKIPATDLVHAARSGWELAPRTVPDASPARAPVARTSPAAERARVTATRAIRAAMQHIAAHDPQLGEHLHATIRTGASCAYTPDPRLAPLWEL
jgi:hypothetical protein